uniref:Ig-like domain-containing protein n=1 Tax=Hucho hucho TaxID=62062 RepID=A0A4W5NHU9_9TELE
MVGQKPQNIVTMTKYDMPVWHKDFNHSRFNVEKAGADGMYRLAITNTDPTDEAVYYCAVRTAYEANFINGTLLLWKGKNHQRSHYHTCTVLSETCTGEHSVYWFRSGSGESHPGVLYTPGDKSDECEKSPETSSPTQRCVYSLSKNNLSPSDAGTYYCAVATCREILFGDGTKLDIKGTFMTTINVNYQMGRSLGTLELINIAS